MSQFSRNSIVIVAVLAMAIVSNSLHAQSKDPISTKYVAKDAFLVVSIQPSKIADCADQKSETTKYVLNSIKKFSGLEVKKLDQIMLQMCAGKDIKDPSEAVIVTMQFSGDVDADAIVKTLGADFNLEKTEKNGNPLYKPEDDDKPCMYFPNKKTMVMCLESRLSVALAGGKNSAAGFAKKITTADHCI